MIVEALINLKDMTGEKTFDGGDIITIQPIDTNWGTGDLKGRIVVQIELPDFPCGADFMVRKRCSQCEHQGIDWASETLTVGDTVLPKLTCPKEQYTSPDCTFTFTLSDKGIPGVGTVLNAKRRAKLDLTDVLSPASTENYILETDLSEKEKDDKLEIARKESNLITTSSLVIKNELTVK